MSKEAEKFIEKYTTKDQNDWLVEKKDIIAKFMESYHTEQLRIGGVVSSKTLRSKIANKRERIKGDLQNATNIINGNKGMSSDYIIDKTRSMPFLRSNLNLIDELLED